MAWTKQSFQSLHGEHIITMSEVVVNDANKTLDIASDDVSTNGIAEIVGIRVEYVADATVGVRTINIEVLDDGDNIIMAHRAPVASDIAASTTEISELIPGMGESLAGLLPASTSPHIVNVPRMLLSPDDKLRVFIVASSGAIGAADDMEVHVRIKLV